MNDEEVAEGLFPGIDSTFLGKHSQDEDLLEWLLASKGASCMAISMASFVEPNRTMLYKTEKFLPRGRKLLNHSKCPSLEGRGVYSLLWAI